MDKKGGARSKTPTGPKFFPAKGESPGADSKRSSKAYKTKYGPNPVDEMGVGWVVSNERTVPRYPLGTSPSVVAGSADSAVVSLSKVLIPFTWLIHRAPGLGPRRTKGRPVVLWAVACLGQWLVRAQVPPLSHQVRPVRVCGL